MNFIDKLKNHRLRYREKFSNSYHRQLFRLGEMLVRHPTLSTKQGVLKAMLGLTYRCQCNCIYCCSGRYPKVSEDELSTREIEKLISQIASLPSLFTLMSFFGGEPLLRDDLYYLIRYATKRGLFTEVESNGVLLSGENVLRLKKAGLHHVFIRIEGSKAQIHDALSNYDGCFEKTIEGIKNCVKERLSCSISTIALRKKIYNNELKEIIELGKSLGVNSIRILYPTLAGNWLREDSKILNDREEDMVKELLRPDFVYLESTYTCTKETNRICPSEQKKFFYISPYGEIQPCPFVPINFENARLENLNEVLNRMWQHSIFRDNRNRCLMNDLKFRQKYIK